jgi:hypothetical protein
VLNAREQLRSLELLGKHLVRYGYETAESFQNLFQSIAGQQALCLLDPLRTAVDRVTPPGAKIAVVSKGDETLLQFGNRQGWHFPQDNEGDFAGCYPADSTEAIEHLEAVRTKGAEFLLLPKTAFWWLDHYAELRTQLDSRYRKVASGEDCVIYDIRESSTATLAGE